MFSKFFLVKISIKYLESKSMIIFLRHKWVAGDGVSITSYCRRLCPPPAIPYLEGGDRKNVIFLPSFFWLINFGQLPDQIFNLTLPPDLFWICQFWQFKGYFKNRRQICFLLATYCTLFLHFSFPQQKIFLCPPYLCLLPSPISQPVNPSPRSKGNDVEISWIFTQR